MTDVHALLGDIFPIASQHFSLEWVSEPQEPFRPDSADPGDLYVLLRLITWDMFDGQMMICDVKEQPVLLVPAASRHDERLVAYLRGLRDALLAVMRSQDAAMAQDDQETLGFHHSLREVMPSELVPSEVLKLLRPRTPEDFSQALLTRKRLGRMFIAAYAP
jgi:hypothetical protein